MWGGVGRCGEEDGIHRPYLGYTADADAGPDDPGRPLLLLPEERPMDLKKPPPAPLSAPACCCRLAPTPLSSCITLSPADLKKPPPAPLSAPDCCWARTPPPS